jgi:NAD(P)-dependent dehydrogenase (short-subunit alcohol dehydrogenase family)
VDILVNNAAVMIGAGRSFEDGPSKATLAEWEETFRVNLFGPVFFTNALIPQLLAGTEKKVVNLSSLGADRALHEKIAAQLASYSASKAALATATLNFHLESVYLIAESSVLTT